MVLIISYLIISFLYIIIVTTLSGTSNEVPEKTEQGITTWLFFGAIALFTAFVFIYYLLDLGTLYPLIKNIDKTKTKVIIENKEPKEMYITVNGKEYHFELSNEGDDK